MLPVLACNERILAIWEEDGRIVSWCTLFKVSPLVVGNITPGRVRKPTLTASMTVDLGSRL
jgi:hypothetical protein